MPLPLQFRLNPTDRAGFYDEPFFRQVQATGAAQGVNAIYTVPDDRMLILQNICWDMIGGGGQLVDGAVVYVADSMGNALAYLHNALPGTVRYTADRQLQSIIIPRSSKVYFLGAFSAAVNVNTVTGYLAGMLTAHGNFPAV